MLGEVLELFSGHGRQNRDVARGSCRLREPGHGPPSPFSRHLIFLFSLPLSSSFTSNEKLIQEEDAFWPSEPKACSVPCLLIPRTMSFLKSMVWRVQLHRAVVRLAVDSSIYGAHFLGHRKAFRGCLPQLLLRLRSTPKPWR